MTRYSAKKEEYIQAGKQLESYRAQLNAAAKIAAENRLDNQIKDMIAEIDSSVREYSTYI
ncbi:MAG: hypothetical protein IJW67_08615 [Blautia sp.]|nr:hypothetical protein [Blautia sp.]